MKLNAADYARDTCELQENRALEHVREIGTWGLVDTIEVSGGDYEDPRAYSSLAPSIPPHANNKVNLEFIDTTQEYKSARQVVYESFAERSIDILATCTPTATSRPPPLVLLTGGLNTLPRMSSALAHDHAHLLGIGRLSVLHPHLPAELVLTILEAVQVSGSSDESNQTLASCALVCKDWSPAAQNWSPVRWNPNIE